MSPFALSCRNLGEGGRRKGAPKEEMVCHILVDIYKKNLFKNRGAKWWGCLLTKIFLPFDELFISQPNDEFFFSVTKISLFVSQLTKTEDSKKSVLTLPNAEKISIKWLGLQ